MDFRKRLKEAMTAKGMTVKSLSAAASIPASTLKTWLNPNKPTEPTDLQALKRVCTALDHTIETLYFGEAQSPQAINELLKHISTRNILSGWVKLSVDIPADEPTTPIESKIRRRGD